MHRYITGRLTAAFISAIGWFVALIGGVAAFLFYDVENVRTFLPYEIARPLQDIPAWPFVTLAIIILLTGLIIVAVGQILRATLHTANNSFEILEVITQDVSNLEPDDEDATERSVLENG